VKAPDGPAQGRPDNPVHDGGHLTSVRALRQAVAAAALASGEAGLPLLVVVDSPGQALGAAAWLHGLQREGCIVARERATESLRKTAAARGFAVLEASTGILHEPTARRPQTPGRVWLLTSGTTGEPKWVAHDWASLVTIPAGSALPPRHWLLTYQPGSYAWYQVASLGLFFEGQTLTLPPEMDPAVQVATAAATGVDAVSSTPTFWRMAMLQAGEATLRRLLLKQVTLGGERVDQAILDQLRRLYPAARISHIYASTEAGAAIVVHDGKAGFPAAWLDAPAAPDRPALQVRDGRLWVASPKSGLELRGWQDTGDRVEAQGDRVVVVGREGDGMVKVGGATVDCRQVEAVLLGHPGILWAQVRGRRAPLVGNLLVAAYVPRAGPLEAEALTRYCEERMAPYMVPRFWEALERIPATSSLKTELKP
jgi:acyl-CoA synthetase (AMP-forming)/AMP-acid ligase II